MIPLIVVSGFGPTWRSTSHHPWMWNSATTTTITVKIPEISVDFVLDHSSPPLNIEAAQSQPPPAALARKQQSSAVTNRPRQVQGFSEAAVYVSTQGTFILGFFELLDSSYSYLGMWNARDLAQRKVWDWVAIKQKLVSVDTGNFTMEGDSKLMTVYIGGTSFVFNSNEAAPSSNSTAIIHYSDNLLMIMEFSQCRSDKGVLWQNLDHSRNILIPGTKLGRSLQTGRNLSLIRWKGEEPSAPGICLAEWSCTASSTGRLIWRRQREFYQSSGMMGKHSFQNHSGLSFRAADSLGNYAEDRGIIRQNAKTGHPNLSLHYASFSGRLSHSVSRDGPSDLTPCIMVLSLNHCKRWWGRMLEDLFSAGYRRGNKSWTTWAKLMRRNLWTGAAIQQSRRHAIVINTGRNNWRLWITISGLVILMLFAIIFFFRRKLKGKKDEEAMLHELTTSNRFNDLEENGNGGKHGHKLKVFNFDSIMIATNNFSSENIIGKGGFGHVYKGRLIDGQEIAVKRLSRGSGQGLVEFKNEIRLITKLQHMNIVRLLGCSINGEERILIYEFMPNKSLDFFLFDTTCKKLLDWKKRYNIIEGIAQGLLYLHKYSRLRIIHRDLKASNILLDHDMNPKISDFGMARIVRRNAVEENTKRIVGTIGYMSPEYVMKGIFSVKSDVYSFGVLMLEIISGRKNKIFHHNDCTTNLVGYAWDLWKEGRSLELVDPELEGSDSTAQMLRCIHVAMLFVQDNAANRPTVSDAISMFTNETVPLPSPTLPIAAVDHTGELGSCATSITISETEGR